MLLADRQMFAELKTIREQPIHDPLVARQIAVLYLQYLGQQTDPALIKEITARSNAVEKAYGVYRAHVGGKELNRERGPRGLANFPRFRAATCGLGSEQSRRPDPRAGP